MEDIKINKIQVRNNAILTTATRRFKEEEREKYFEELRQNKKIFTTADSKNLPILVQKVINVGPMVRDIKEGDIVKISPFYYLSRKLQAQENSIQKDVADYAGVSLKEFYSELDYTFPIIKLNETEYLMLFDRDVDYIILDGVDTDGKVLHSER